MADTLAASPSPAVRILKVQLGRTELSVPVKSDPPSHIWDAADQIIREFHALVKAEPAEEVDESVAYGRVLSFVEAYCLDRPDHAEAHAFLKAVVASFQGTILRGNDVHAVVARRGLVDAEQRSVVRAYYSARHFLEPSHPLVMSPPPSPRGEKGGQNYARQYRPALVAAVQGGSARLAALFGGQGNESYFDELGEIYSTYPPSRPFVDAMSARLATEAASPEAASVGYYKEGLDVTRWLHNPAQVPSSEYMLSAPVSFPLIALTQLAHYWVALGALGMTPAEFSRLLSHTAGHSQGIVACLVVSSAQTAEDFFELSRKALLTLFWMAVRAQQVYPSTTLNPAIQQDSLANGEGTPTPMLSVRNVTLATVEQHVRQTNKHLPEDRHIEITLVNGPHNVVVAGHPQSLHALSVALRRLRAREGESQSRVPHSKRKLRFTTRYLPVSVPFHSRHMASVPEKVMRDVERLSLAWTHKLHVPVHSTYDGHDLRNEPNLTAEIIRLVCTAPVNWEKTIAPIDVTHMIDFGPGGMAGIGYLTHHNKEGTGVQVIAAGYIGAARPGILDKSSLFSTDATDVRYTQDWGIAFAPRLVRVRSTGVVHLDTRMSRLLGRPPIMVAGMTPSTVSDKFVAAVTNAGFHVELAGGGHYTEKALRERIAKIVAQTGPGDGITINILYLNARQWAFQFPLVQQLRREGVPIEGVCIAAGVPSPDTADEILSTLKEAGVRHVSFKPGSVDSIRQVVGIAERHPSMPIMLQWTGGRAGGHHSFEDFHQPIFETYGAIRKQGNIVLVAGSGIGDGEGSFPYITGEWSVAFGYPRMPFDGVLLGSRVMVARECATSSAVKRFLAERTPGIEDEAHWEATYDGVAGGITTVVSELGEPIHKVANRGVMLWKRLDKEIFSLPAEKQADSLARSKSWIVKALNDDYQKVYFGRRLDGCVCDLPDMTYEDVAHRIVELMFVADQRRWIDPSYRTFAFDFLARVEERFACDRAVGGNAAILQAPSSLDADPLACVVRITEAYAGATRQLLTTEDVQFFLSMCKRPGQKPVPFVPSIDADFKTYFKKDSLWQAEDIDAVVGRDVERVCILQGPVAARHSRVADEPVAEILGGIYRHYVDALRLSCYPDERAIAEVEYIGGADLPVSSPSASNRHRSSPTSFSSSPLGTVVTVVNGETQYTLGMPDAGVLPEHDEWLELLAGPQQSWLRALLTSPGVVQGKSIVANPVRRILRPRYAQRVVVRRGGQGGQAIAGLDVYDAALVEMGVPPHRRSVPATVPSVEVRGSVADGKITVVLNEMKAGSPIPLILRYEYRPATGYALIHETMGGRLEIIKSFYSRLWLDEPLTVSSAGDWTVPGSLRATHTVGRAELVDFCQAVGNRGERHVERGQGTIAAPLDYAIVAGWRAIIRALFHANLGGDLLRLVHLSNSFTVLDPSRMLQEGDVVETVGEIIAIENQSGGNGRLVEVRGVLSRVGSAGAAVGGVIANAVVSVTSQFLYRGRFDADYSHTFRRTTESPRRVVLSTPEAIAILRAKEWIAWTPEADALVVPGASLVFELCTEVRYRGPNIYASVATSGRIMAHKASKEIVQIGAVNYISGAGKESRGNPVIAYLERAGARAEEVVLFPDGGRSILPPSEAFSSTVQAPATNEHYAAASGDLNPIHVNPYFAAYADLPDTITHGMWTSASVRRFVEVYAGDNDPSRVSSYSAHFVGMVLPNDRLSIQLSHVGMRNGRKVVRVEARNQHGVSVLEGTAEVEQPRTAYVFTGQGAQEVGMGMDLYDSSEVARAVWDRAERHFRDTYGFSILRVVRTNPIEMTVHFGGATGRRIRQNYMGMTFDVCGEDGTVSSRSLFPDIRNSTLSYTFSHPQGLLSATQFTQPALVLFEKAAFEDMQAKGLVQERCVFAGHSLGEYAALAALGDVLPIESLVDVCFYRGMTMQCAVPRDSSGRSNYGMAAVNPMRAGLHALGDAGLQFVCQAIATHRRGLLEIVNHNVDGWQYVVAGELGCLDTLTGVMNAVRARGDDIARLVAAASLATVKEELGKIVATASAATDRRRDAAPGGILQLERGVATIPLPGIDVPFHSRFLLSGVGLFRQYLGRRLSPKNIDIALLTRRYIPNLTAEPFSIGREYFERVLKITDSESVANVIESWPASRPLSEFDPEEQQRLGYVLLVELLAYQFASPVRWIETQDRVFREFDIERLVEVGPQPTLTQMAIRTLKLKYEAYDEATSRRRQVLCFGKDKDQLYFERDGVDAVVPAVSDTAAAPKPAPVSVPISAAPVHAVAVGDGSSVPDVPMTAEEVVQTVIAIKTKRKIAAVPLTTSIKELSAGKSTLQNEIVGDLAKEFGTIAAERPEEMPLSQLAAAIQPRFSGKPGKQTAALVARLFSAKMPGGFSVTRAREHLRTQRHLGDGRTDGVFLFACSEEPDARLGSESDAIAWLDRVTDMYGGKQGLSIPNGSPAAPAFAGASYVPVQGANAQAIPDTPVSALEFLRTLLAVKLKRPLSAVPGSQTIKALVGGKSALQNELVGDIQLEFGAVVDSAAEMTLEQLGQSVGPSYKGLGKCSRAMISRTVSAKMPAGVALSSLRQQLSTRGLGEGRQDAVLLRAVAMEPPQRLASEAECKTWLDGVVSAYASDAGISLADGQRAGAAGAGGASHAAMSAAGAAAAAAFSGKHSELLREQIALFRAYLGEDPFEGERQLQRVGEEARALQVGADKWLAEHGEEYSAGIQAMFDSLKIRRYDSYFNWARQDVAQLYGEIVCCENRKNGDALDDALVERLVRRSRHIVNRATLSLVDMIEHRVKHAAGRSDDPREQAIARWGEWLIAEIKATLAHPPIYRSDVKPTQPVVSVGDDGRIEYSEVPREGAPTAAHYVEQMQRADATPKSGRKNGKKTSAAGRKAVHAGPADVPYLHLRSSCRTDPSRRVYDPVLTRKYFAALAQVAGPGVSFKGKTVLITGCGRGSIGADILTKLIVGGADVIVTTSSFSRKTTEYYRGLYEQFGARGSSLVVLPFNQGSKQDVDALVKFIYEGDGLATDIDVVIPFAAISENGRPLGSIDARSELAHRIMLTNVIRLLGEIRNAKESRGQTSRPALAILPLSPNHGLFGSDGLYAESKIGLETLFHKWHSEDWAPYLSIAGAVIGWTRGTGLMSSNDIVAPGIEDLGVRTFSTSEMALNIMALMHPSVVELSQEAPVWADFGGGFETVCNFNEKIATLRKDLSALSAVRAAVAKDAAVDEAVVTGGSHAELKSVERRANMRFAYPVLPTAERIESLAGERLHGMLDLDRVVVVVGYGEVGPWGSARTRWEMERNGEFSLEGCLELAWMMGYIRHHNGPLADGKPYAGWVDAATGLPVRDAEVKERYEQQILSHAGVRVVEPSMLDGFDPSRKQFLHQVAITRDLPPMETSAEQAVMFKREHGDKADVYEGRDGNWVVVLRKGATMYVPKAMRFDRFVAGQIPTGWDATRYGVPKDIAAQVDPVTLFNLVSTAEALISAGITDPYEMYKYVHVTEVGNTTGGGMGGMKSLGGIYRERYIENPIAGDTLQEVFINTMAAWVNMLLLSASGPIKTPVGACATAVESVELGVDTILSGKARIVVCGGFDDIREESMTEFASMGATSSSEAEAAHGRDPQEMSRPTTSSRSGFMEAQGAGNQVLMSASLAIEMGVPVYGIVALTSTAMDKEGRSVPAPGKGILTSARERRTAFPSPLLSLDYRRRQLESQRAQIDVWRHTEVGMLRDDAARMAHEGLIAMQDVEAYVAERTVCIQDEAVRQEKAAMAMWGNEFYVRDPTISPIRGALSVYGLNIDDIGVASFHGTSTKANDTNESHVLNRQMDHLGRSRGNPVPAVCQKYLTGHPKGPAAAWMLNGVLQCIESGVIPGNRNADNIDKALAEFEHVLYPSHSLKVPIVKAGLLKSFGFGQVGGEVLVVNPLYLYAAIGKEEYAGYARRRGARELQTYRHMHNAMTGTAGLVQVKDRPPYTPEREQHVYLDPLARATRDERTGAYAFLPSHSVKTASEIAIAGMERVHAALAQVQDAGVVPPSEGGRGVGVDIEPFESFAMDNPTFIERNFTDAECRHCSSQADPRASYAGRWCAKEAVIKAISSASRVDAKLWDGPSAGLADIEVLPSATGAPSVMLHGTAADAMRRAGIETVRVSITHAGEYAMAVAIAQ